MKGQNVRLADVFFIGPLMVWAGFKLTDEHPILGPTLAVLGAATVVYNGYNYLQLRDEEQLVAILVTDLNDAGFEAGLMS